MALRCPDCVIASELLMAGIESIHVLQGHVDYYAAGPRDTLEVSVTVVIVLLLSVSYTHLTLPTIYSV